MIDDDDPDLKGGRELASLLLPMMQDGADETANPRAFWGGLIAAIVGWASVTVDLRVILHALADQCEQCPTLPGKRPDDEEVH